MQSQCVGVPVDAPAWVALWSTHQAHCAVQGGLPPETIMRAVKVRTAICGLIHRNPRELRQLRLEALPDPVRNELAGGVLQAADVVQAGEVQFCMDERPKLVEVLGVDTDVPVARVSIRMDDGRKAMAVHPSALMVERGIGQVMRGVEGIAAQKVRMVVAIGLDPSSQVP
jgi:hypothetical protein